MLELPFVIDLEAPTNIESLFPEALSDLEIKMAGAPYNNHYVHATKAFQGVFLSENKILDLNYVNKSPAQLYIDACSLILSKYYQQNAQIFDDAIVVIKNGSFKTFYKVSFIHEFASIQPQNKTIPLSNEDIALLMQNYDNIDLWKEKFPIKSYIFKGFSILNFTDITDQYYKNKLSTLLLKDGNHTIQKIESILKSLFKIENFSLGVSVFKLKKNKWMYSPFNTDDSLLFNPNTKEIENYYNSTIGYQLFDVFKPLIIQTSNKTYHTTENEEFLNTVADKKLKSIVLIPQLFHNKKHAFVVELGFNNDEYLTSKQLFLIESFLPLLKINFERQLQKYDYLIDAVIQRECTAIHSSVKWKFDEAAKEFIEEQEKYGSVVDFKDIVFKDVYPLYGQIDIKSSSKKRNIAAAKDFILHFNVLDKLLDNLNEKHLLINYKYLKRNIKKLKKELNIKIDAQLESTIHEFLNEYAHPTLIDYLKNYEKDSHEILSYFEKLDDTDSVYYYRKNYDKTVNVINKRLATFLDTKQQEAQLIHPHLFERYKTDGVEHNIYIGSSINEDIKFKPEHLEKLRLWQLRTMCQMERFFNDNKHQYPVSLEMASMILVYNKTLDIRFRKDEKLFDVDGSYNVRYQVMKSRIDKAFIKNTEERITQPGKITIMFDHTDVEELYRKFINILQQENLLKDEVELLEVEQLRGISSLQALRVSIAYS
ncbi:hypothetical protein [Tenacibaculum sp. IB213877]|uniref:hypothetical protein n=1 Tax=Tenacibaculum sp. IB213877 TaxID=3097351 RepID=UPI002A5A895F|nr:hypothetical protein [Tenacibaculum sp. IB213877]MDY0779330.1 hypothetical protein [Tenacibaculum sp. IB213877]